MSRKVKDTEPFPPQLQEPLQKPLTLNKRKWYEDRRNAATPGSKAYRMADGVLRQDDALKKKGLHLATLEDRHLEKKPLTERSVLLFERFKIESREGLETIANFNQLRQAIQNTSNIHALRMADSFAEELRELIQQRIKTELWGKNLQEGESLPEGKVSFSVFVQDDTRAYLKASVRGSSRLVEPLEGAEKEEALREHQERQRPKSFQDQVKKNTHKKGVGRT